MRMGYKDYETDIDVDYTEVLKLEDKNELLYYIRFYQQEEITEDIDNMTVVDLIHYIYDYGLLDDIEYCFEESIKDYYEEQLKEEEAESKMSDYDYYGVSQNDFM